MDEITAAQARHLVKRNPFQQDVADRKQIMINISYNANGDDYVSGYQVIGRYLSQATIDWMVDLGFTVILSREELFPLDCPKSDFTRRYYSFWWEEGGDPGYFNKIVQPDTVG